MPSDGKSSHYLSVKVVLETIRDRGNPLLCIQILKETYLIFIQLFYWEKGS
jgi:hypothetical protein